MKEEIYLTILFDYYESLLTDKQINYFKDYYLNNLSLSEIAINDNVTRNAIHRQLKIVKDKLLMYESVLHLYEKDQKLQEIINTITDKKLKESLQNFIERN